MKLNKYLMGLAVVAMGGLTACNTDVEGALYPFSNDYAQFDVASQSVSISNTEDHVTVPVSIIRSNTSDALTVNFTTAASHEGIFSNDANGTVTFSPGQGTATFNVTAQNLEKEVPYQYALSLAGDPVGVLSLVQNGDTVEYKPGQLLSTVIKVQREGDWTQWTAWNSTGTADYYYTGSYWSGVDEDLNFYYRQSLTNPTQYKFRIDNWGGGISLLLDYDETTGRVSIPPTFTGYTTSNNGDLYISDMANYLILEGDEPSPEDYGTFDKENGILTIPVIYYVADGYFGYDLEYIYIDGYVRVDYSMELTYEGYLTDANGGVYAQGNLTLSDDISKAVAIVAPLEADPEAVADGLAAGDYEGVEVEAGQIRVPISEDLTGELQIIVAIIEEGEVKNVVSAKFEYFGGSASPWKKLGTGYLTDDFVTSMFVDENKNPYPPETVEVQIEESNETPGLYRIKNAYASIAASFGAEGGNEDLIIHAEDPNGVYFLTSPLGFDLGNNYTNITIISYGGSAIEYFTDPNNGGYPIATVINAFADEFGKLENGVITFPGIQAEDQEGNPQYYEDGSPILFQGYTYMSGTGYYGGTNVAFKVVLPSAAAAVKAKAKAQAAKSAHTHHKANLSNSSLIKTKMTRSQMRKAKFAKKVLPKTLKTFKR